MFNHSRPRPRRSLAYIESAARIARGTVLSADSPSSAQFSYEPATRTFTSEASEFRVPLGASFYMRSVRTGLSVEFVLTGKDTDRGGEVTAWKYRAVEVVDLTAIVFND